MNIVQRMSQNMVQSGINIKTETDMILHWKAGKQVVHIKTSMPNQKVQESCMVIKLPLFLRFLPIGKLVEKMKDLESGFFKCVGHHDGLDKFASAIQFPPKWVPKFL